MVSLERRFESWRREEEKNKTNDRHPKDDGHFCFTKAIA
jgi:hypothetical protein